MEGAETAGRHASSVVLGIGRVVRGLVLLTLVRWWCSRLLYLCLCCGLGEHFWEVNWEEDWFLAAIVRSEDLWVLKYHDSRTNLAGTMQTDWLLIAILSRHECVSVSRSLVISITDEMAICHVCRSSL